MATQQEVMKAFMHALDETDKSGRAALDEAVKASSSFTSYQEVINKFAEDFKATGNWHTFLVKYCGIILDNKDTGSIMGKDAGGSTSKGPEDIIPCKGDVTYPSGTSFTVNGLTIYGVPDKETLTDDEQFIVQGLYSWWIKESLDLIEESYGLSYTEENTTNARMKLKLYEDDDDGTLAYVEYGGDDGKEFESRALSVNMTYFKDISPDNRQGKVKVEGIDLYLTRTIVHELVHGVMASNVNYFGSLPLPIIEGATAELVHGIDDKRRNDIINYTKDAESFGKLINYLMPESAGVNMDLAPYAGGYIFMRYFLKQASDTTFDYDTYRENVTVDDENFAVNYFDKVTMSGTSAADTITNSGENVTINALDGANLIRNYSDNVKITSGAGMDTIYNESSSVEIISGSGDDSITSSGKNSTINSGAGDDLITSSGENSTINSGAGNDTIFGGNSNIKTNAGAGNDNITLLLGFGNSIYSNNTVYSGKGNDTINSDFTSCIFYGEAGNDSIKNSGANSSLKGGAGVDSITNTGSYAMIWGDAGNDIIINGQSNNGTFGVSTSSIGANSTVYGGAGKDSLTNFAMSSFIYGGRGKDSIENSGASSALYGDAGNDYFSNESNSVSIHGGKGKDSIENSGDDSALYGNAGNDYITNISDSVSIFGGKGKDSIENRGDDVLIECGAGNDSIYNSGANITVDLGAGKDYLYNEGAKISISGGAGNDKIYNFGDHVTISGGAGKDYIENSGGKHITYEFGASDGKDTLVGFSADDTIKITRGGYSAATSGNDVVVSVGKAFMTLKDATGIEINFITAADKTETWSGDNNLSSIVKDNLSSIAYGKIDTTDFETLAQDNISLAYSDK